MKLIKILSETIEEALELSTAKKYASIVRSPEVNKRMDDIFSELKKDPNYVNQSRNGERLYFDVDFEAPKNLPDDGDPSIEYTGDMYNTFNKVRMFLGGNNYEASLSDYKEGIAFDKNGKSIKIGKLIVKVMNTTSPSEEQIKYYKDLLSSYEKDKIRAKVSTSKLYMVISKAKYDIAGMSTGRGWTSCMSLNGGSNRQYVSCDVREGSIISYLVSKTDMNIQNPISRINIKPFINKKDDSDIVYIPEDAIYGIPVKGFYESLTKMFRNIQPDSIGIFKLHDELVSDSDETVVFGNFGDTIDNNNAKDLIDRRYSRVFIDNLDNIKYIKDINITEVEDIDIRYCNNLKTIDNIKCKGDISIGHNKNLTTIKDVFSEKSITLNSLYSLKYISGKSKHLKLYNIKKDFLKNFDFSNLESKIITITLFEDIGILNININSNVDTLYIEDHRSNSDALVLPEKIGSGNLNVYITRSNAPRNANIASYPDNKNYKVLKNK